MSMDSGFNSTSGTPLDGAEPPEPWDEMLLVGVVARAQGNKGEVVVNATTDFPEQRFAAGSILWCRRAAGSIERLEVQAWRMHLGRPVLTLAGVASIGEAEQYAGAELRVPVATMQPLPPDVYYLHELVGCAVWTAAGERVGEVSAVEGDGAAVRLVVRTMRDDVLVPFTQAFCTVDRAARRIEITPPEGLLELNGAWQE
jgi:16S rRNA processing protein RimM